MIHKIDAIYENGVLRPIGPLGGLPERALVSVTVDTASDYISELSGLFETQSDDASEVVEQFVEAEFARMNARKLN